MKCKIDSIEMLKNMQPKFQNDNIQKKIANEYVKLTKSNRKERQLKVNYLRDPDMVRS